MESRGFMGPLNGGAIVRVKNPPGEDEKRERRTLLEDPQGGRLWVQGICDLPIKPTRVVRIEEVEK
jgi:hypothetical protein